MSEKNIATEYSNNFTKPSIRVGTVTVLLAMIASFLPNIYLYVVHGVFPDMAHLMTAWGSVAVVFGAFYIVEPVSYFPIFGLTGTYIGILSGNISQIRLPAASTAQDVVGAQAGTEKGEVVGILAICGSVVTNILFLTAAVTVGSVVMGHLPASVTNALSKFILPSLFGACFAMAALKKLSIALYALPLCLALRLCGVSAWQSIVGAIFGTILITYALYKAKIVK